VTAVLIFPLLLVGAGVTSKDAGMAFPDWPTSDGYLLNPPGWLGANDKLWEHGHRLIGWAVGLSGIVLAVICWPVKGPARLLALGTVFAIAVQGVMGGLRVTEDSTELAMVHGIWGQVCFCLAVLTALTTSRPWQQGPNAFLEVRSARALQGLGLFVTAGLFLQLAAGASLRHFGTGLALVIHVLWAAPVIFCLGWWVMWLMGYGWREPLLKAGPGVLGILGAVQLMLGGLAWLVTLAGGQWPVWMAWMVPTAHVGVGALMLALSVLLTVQVFRRLGPSAAASRGTVTSVAAA
jgi:cytochrome c oxidase assembly protein subunit 15